MFFKYFFILLISFATIFSMEIEDLQKQNLHNANILSLKETLLKYIASQAKQASEHGNKLDWF